MSGAAVHLAAPQRPLWHAGMIIGGRYRLVGPIGRGAMGEVWRAQHVTLGHDVAVKLVAATQANGGETLQRFLREAQAAAALRSSHVVQIFDHGAEGPIAYIAMEMLEGESLGDRLARKARLSPLETAQIIRDMARGLAKAHDLGIIHRDLKPHNVFLAQVDGREVVKILDFGIAKLTTDQRGAFLQTNAATVLGTPAYMSPEQVLASQPLDWRSDLWQLAIIAFECLVGQLPFQANSLGELFMKICSSPLPVPSQVAPVPQGFDAWFARATQRDPKQRFASAKDLSDALTAVLAPSLGALDIATMAGVTRAAAPPSEHSSSKRLLVLAAALALCTMGIGVALFRALRAPAAQGSATPSVIDSADTPPPPSTAASAAPADTAAPSASAAPANTVASAASAAPADTVPRPARTTSGPSRPKTRDWGF